jgi:hypothetical protein
MSNQPGYETSDVSVGTLNKYLAGLFVLLFVSILFSWGCFILLENYEKSQNAEPTLAQADQPLPPSPRLQVTNADDLHVFRAKEQALVGSYGWVDKNAGVTRLPVERAIEIVAERGLPNFTAKEPAKK